MRQIWRRYVILWRSIVFSLSALFFEPLATYGSWEHWFVRYKFSYKVSHIWYEMFKSIICIKFVCSRKRDSNSLLLMESLSHMQVMSLLYCWFLLEKVVSMALKYDFYFNVINWNLLRPLLIRSKDMKIQFLVLLSSEYPNAWNGLKTWFDTVYGNCYILAFSRRTNKSLVPFCSLLYREWEKTKCEF